MTENECKKIRFNIAFWWQLHKLCISRAAGFCYEKEGVTSEKSDIALGAAC